MAFCKFCGTELEGNQACSCEQAKAEVQQAVTPEEPVNPAPPEEFVTPLKPAASKQLATQTNEKAEAFKKKASEAAKNTWVCMLSYCKNPGQATTDTVARDQLDVAIVLAVLRALSMGLALFGVLVGICKSVYSVLYAAVGSYSSLLDLGNAVAVVPPFFGSLFNGILIAIIGMALFIAAVFGISKLQKSPISIKCTLIASAVNGMPTTALLLLAFVFSLFSLNLGMIFLLLACLCWIICGVITVQYTCPADNTSGRFWLLYFVGVILVLVIGYYVISNLFLNAAGGIRISAAGESFRVKTLIKEIKSALGDAGSFSGLIEALIGEFF